MLAPNEAEDLSPRPFFLLICLVSKRKTRKPPQILTTSSLTYIPARIEVRLQMVENISVWFL